jgi:UDP-GlcNAc:undecaprenyl-phosphate GlcNAc-1-phosphate transferase
LALGFIDDIHPMPVRVRLAALLGAGIVWAIVAPAAGSWDAAMGGILVVVLANAVNLIDGQDGLAGSLALIAAVGLSVILGQGEYRTLGFAMAGALGGFLVWNKPPAKIFLGNGGAYGLGASLAVLSTGALGVRGVGEGVPVVLCLSPFLFELVFTVVRRSVSGSALSGGDRLHTYDLLSVRLGSRARSTLAMAAVGILLTLSAIALQDASLALSLLALAAAVALGVVAGVSLWTKRPVA